MGGFLQCPPSIVRIQASGKRQPTDPNISSKAAFEEANWYAWLILSTSCGVLMYVVTNVL